MGMVQMNNEASITNRSAKPNHHSLGENREWVRGEGQGLSEEDESRINEDVHDVNNGQMEAIQVQDLDQDQSAQWRPKKQPRRRLVRWDRFLPFRSLKVLLVENDDSTRNVVSALLRNCGYEVKDVPNGKKAWKVLEDLTTDVHLVLTEVVMPCLSGISLLCKITSNKAFKDIPVIMMSSHDSRTMVFKCLSKGAVDFLAKPIRKNELKNLWQHVWRKHHIMNSITVEDSDITGSNDEYHTESIDLDSKDESDSGTQSSWTRAVDLESPRAMSPRDQFADYPDRTSAQAILPREEAFGNNWPPKSATTTPVGQDDQFDKKTMGKYLKISICSIPNLQLDEKALTSEADKSSELDTNKNNEQWKKGELDLNNEEPNTQKTQAVDLMGVSTNGTDLCIESVVLDSSNGLFYSTFIKDKENHGNKEIPSFEVISKRSRDVQDTGTRAHDQNVLRNLDLSAFSRYNSASTANQASTGNVGSCSPLDHSSDAVKTESVSNILYDSNGTPPNQRSHGSSNINYMGSTTNIVFTTQVAFADKPTPKSTVKLQTPSSFQQVHDGQAFHPTLQGTSQHGLYNFLKAPMQGNVANRNRNLNRSASGSSRRLNGHKRSTTASNSRGKKMGGDDGLTGKGAIIEASGYGNRSGEDEHRFAHREAALKRFRQKRQERCFEKKVRYQSRKKLAEERPRIRGQFIRKGMQENKGKGISYEPDAITQ